MTDIMARRARGFCLWRPARIDPAPRVHVVSLVPGNPPVAALVHDAELTRVAGQDDLWELPLAGLPLVVGRVYHYWFSVTSDRPGEPHVVKDVTDPFARVVDYRVGPPAAVFKLDAGRLVDCDPDGSVTPVGLAAGVGALPTNNQLVIYELPSSWTRSDGNGNFERDVGTFRDVLALLTLAEPGGNFSDTAAVATRAHLLELGVNAIELLPPADSPFLREWGYATGNYCAADYDLGFPDGNQAPTAESDLRRLVTRMHQLNLRFFCDVVMAFGYTSYRELNFDDYYITPGAERDNPDAYQSSRNGELRDGFGGSLWRYGRVIESYDPIAGGRRQLAPAQSFHLAHLLRWLGELGVDGLRLDSVNNIGNWDFLRVFRDAARAEYSRLQGGAAGVDARFLVVGEELATPLALVNDGPLDAMWNEPFKRRVRAVILGRSVDDESFETTVRRMIDCRSVGYRDGAQAINYVTSHDVEGFENERLTLFLQNNLIAFKEERIKLAFVCLLVAVGVPMILAGEEFADEHDRTVTHPDKQQDPLNFARVEDPWRRRLFDYISRLVRFRVASAALGTNDTTFIHTDFSSGRRVLAWVRGVPGREDPVVVVANFSNVTPPGSEYIVPNWPATPAGRRWREISQARDVPTDWIGREPLYPWEAKVYALA
ncbi:MAG TPA: alpha-amylase family glycosyl hydrolase [Polyangiaceae bacterium]|nr:alpha-amylase family glycosyl hydrolase [Polyangiaceae bacterium]